MKILAASYLAGTNESGGTKSKFKFDDDIMNKVAIDSESTQRLCAILNAFIELKGVSATAISISSIYRAQLRTRYVCKGVTSY